MKTDSTPLGPYIAPVYHAGKYDKYRYKNIRWSGAGNARRLAMRGNRFLRCHYGLSQYREFSIEVTMTCTTATRNQSSPRNTRARHGRLVLQARKRSDAEKNHGAIEM